MINSEDAAAGEKSWIVLESLLCLLREKNLLSRADMEELCDKVQARARGLNQEAMPCCEEALTAAAKDMVAVTDYIGRQYGGKHRRAF